MELLRGWEDGVTPDSEEEPAPVHEEAGTLELETGRGWTQVRRAAAGRR